MHSTSTISRDISKASDILRGGGLVAFPTETVYGLGADATNDAAVARIYAAKGRPQFNPLISHVANRSQALSLGDFPKQAEKIASHFWPGPLTIVVPRRKICAVSLLASAGLDTIALRMPDHPLAMALLEAFARPIAAPSANASGRISPTTAEHVRHSLGLKVDMILDGGPSSVGVESTVVQFRDGKVYLLRPGGLARDVIENAISEKLLAPPGEQALHSPGLLASHYAPQAALRLNARSPNPAEAFIGFGELNTGPYSLSKRGDLIEAAANLFRVLHEVDATGVAAIAVAPIPETGLGEAINDRLRRAAAPRGNE
jgi:L-threonylcarbamoyladenylate synthase